MEHGIIRRSHGHAALACALLLSGCSWLAGDSASPDAEIPAEAGVVGEVKASAERLLTAAREQLGFPAAAPVPAPAPTPPAQPVARTPLPQPAPEPQIAEPLPAPAAEAALAFKPVPPLPPAPAPVLEHGAPVPAAPSNHAVYSSTDDGVQPPAWRSATVSAPQLTGSTGHVPALELIVGTDGSVERARLLQRSRQLPDMMILSSAKMWQFEPAVLDGHPVRYRLIVRLSDAQPLE